MSFVTAALKGACSASSAGSVTIDLKRTRTVWNESVTFNTRPETLDPFLTFSNVFTDTSLLPINIDVTSIIRDLINQTITNFGVEISTNSTIEVDLFAGKFSTRGPESLRIELL
jgi:hypothetical protein